MLKKVLFTIASAMLLWIAFSVYMFIHPHLVESTGSLTRGEAPPDVTLSGSYPPSAHDIHFARASVGMGRSWWIEIESEKPLLLSLDGWSGRIPAGDHKVLSNHDYTNTGDYGDRDFWGFPESVSVQELTPEGDS